MENKEKEEIKKNPNPQTKISYFYPKAIDEEYPFKIPIELNPKYFYMEKVFNLFFQKTSLNEANKLSEKERMDKILGDKCFNYGEITFRTLAYIFLYVDNKYNIMPGNFYDLGSGVGKAVLGAALLYPFEKYIGIEYLSSLYDKSLYVQMLYIENFPNFFKKLGDYMPSYLRNDDDDIAEMKFVNDDFLHYDLSDASFIFVSSTSFGIELYLKLGYKLKNECKLGCIVISLTKPIPELGNNWTVEKAFKRLMSWGVATIYIHCFDGARNKKKMK